MHYLRLLTAVALITGPVYARKQFAPGKQGLPSVVQRLRHGHSTDMSTIISRLLGKSATAAKQATDTCDGGDGSYQTPAGYHLVFGNDTTLGANQADDYMGFTELNNYSPEECAKACNTRAEDEAGGVCKYFNIWKGDITRLDGSTGCKVVCAMYFTPTDSSTAKNFGGNEPEGYVEVKDSRGYRRHTFLPDGGFESYHCDHGIDFCFTNITTNWNGTDFGGYDDATIFHYDGYSHRGHGVGLLGSAYGVDPKPGLLQPLNPLKTTAGKEYTISFFLDNSYSRPELEADSFSQVWWNQVPVLTLEVGYTEWKFYKVNVVGKGDDVLGFYGGRAPAYTFIDDIFVHLA